MCTVWRLGDGTDAVLQQQWNERSSDAWNVPIWKCDFALQTKVVVQCVRMVDAKFEQRTVISSKL
eukprot:SAG31_NODE_2838_length_5017_cov_3.102074_2_plen_65_part_00